MSQKKEKDFKVYVVGYGKGYGRWIEGSLTENMKEADVVVLTGGEDISPKIYDEVHYSGRESYNSQLTGRDLQEINAFQEAQKLGKVIWGTCRGAQLLCALAGGKLVQDMSHYGTHKLHFYDGKYECVTNSLHHQLQYPYTIPKNEYAILAHSKGLSTRFIGANNTPMVMPERSEAGYIKEPEFVYYKKIKGLGIQGHPEMMDHRSDLVKVCHAYLNLLIENKLDTALALNIPVSEIIDRAWDFKFTKEEIDLYKQIVKVKPRNTVVESKEELIIC